MAINEQSLNKLHAAIKQEISLAQSKRDDRLMNELSRINNELVTAQRQVVKQNSELQRLSEMEESVFASELRYRRLFETAQDGILILNAASGEIEDVNPYLCELLGYTFAHFLGKQLWELGAFADVAATKSALRKLRDEKYTRYDDLPLETAEGHQVRVEFVSNVYQVGNENVIQCNIRDITDRRLTEEENKRSQAQLANAQQIAHIGSWESNPETQEVIWSDEMYRILGFKPQQFEVNTETCFEPVHPDDRELINAAVRESAKSQKPFSLCYRIIRADGAIRILDGRGIVTTDESGRAVRIAGSAQDVTDVKLAEQSLIDARDQLQAILDAVPGAVSWIDSDLKYLGANRRLSENCNLLPKDFVGKPVGFRRSDSEFEKFVRRFFAGKESIVPQEVSVEVDGCKRTNLIAAQKYHEDQAAVFVGIDITERKQAEERVQFQAHLLNSVGQAVIAIDSNKTITYWNAFAETLYGWSAHEAIGLNITMLTPDQERGRGAVIMDRIADGERWSDEFLVQRRDGSTFPALVSVKPLYDSAGTVVGAIGASVDITERNQVEQALRRSEERFQSIVANVPGMVYQFLLRPDGSVEFPFVSEGCRDLFDLELHEIQQNASAIIERIHPEDRPSFDLSVANSAVTLLPWKWEGRFELRSGKTHWIQTASRPQRLPDGGTLWDGLLLDITARKKAEEERDRFFTLSLDMLAIAGTDGHFKRLNPAFEATLGFSNAELMSKPFLEFVHPDDHESTLAIMAGLNQGDYVIRFENRYRCHDGSYKWLRWMAAPFENLIYAVAHDITSIKQAEADLQKANDELEVRVLERTVQLELSNREMSAAKQDAEAANLAKSDFLSRMSHELRTPLNAIIGFGQVLDKEYLSPLQKESVQYILKGGRHLLGLINEVLDIARVEAGHVDLCMEPVPIADLVLESCNLVNPLAVERNIRLNGNVSAPCHCYVLADGQRLKQVLINLLSNGIKYNRPGGSVDISCSQKPDGQVRIDIQDTGLGIANEDRPKLFSPFERLNAASTGVEGTGLGLVLSQRLVLAMGGTLDVTSVLGEGSVFSIELPQAESPHTAAVVVPEQRIVRDVEPSGGKYTVLCIEDNLSNLRLLEVILQSRPGVTLLPAMQGSVGLDLARQHEPDLILLDLNLPDIPGQEVLARLQQSALTRDIPVIVISADATPLQVDRLLAAGARVYVTKPLEVARFLNVLDEILGRP